MTSRPMAKAAIFSFVVSSTPDFVTAVKICAEQPRKSPDTPAEARVDPATSGSEFRSGDLCVGASKWIHASRTR